MISLQTILLKIVIDAFKSPNFKIKFYNIINRNSFPALANLLFIAVKKEILKNNH
jgi:hypothetical protein